MGNVAVHSAGSEWKQFEQAVHGTYCIAGFYSSESGSIYQMV